MMVLVGCPVKGRNWILGAWFDHVLGAVPDPTFIFAADTQKDHVTVEFIDQLCAARGLNRVIVHVDDVDVIDNRVWNLRRYHHMAYLRNELLKIVRIFEPDLYWSVDSDILVAPDTFSSAVLALSRFDAVGSRCYMSPYGTVVPSYGMLNGGGLLRPDAEGCFPVDVIMAVKLMTPPAYAVDYQPHEQGEDIGWSIAATDAGVKLGWDGLTVSKHVMEPKFLEPVDARCGF